MKNSHARAAILGRIQQALLVSVPKPFSDHLTEEIYINAGEPLLETFSAEFEALQGKLILCGNETDLVIGLQGLSENRGWKNLYCQTPMLLEKYQLDQTSFVTNLNPGGNFPAITDCEVLIARTGTMILSAAQSSGRALPVHTPVHIVIASLSQLVYDIKDGIDKITVKYGDRLPSALFFTTGPSRTGDIEKTLVMGVHGPIEVYIFLRTDQ